MSRTTHAVSWTPGVHAPWVDQLNALGANLGAATHLISLDAPSLLAEATATTGLDDFGGDTWREPFDVLIDAIAREAELTTVGRLLTRAEILRALENRLRIVATRGTHPSIAAGEISAPIFITGTARSGTSILFELLAQDPRFRTPATWEIFYSTPPPETATYGSDPRIASTHAEVTLWHEITPAYLTMHANGGALPNECIFLMLHEFTSAHFSGVLDVPTYARWLATHELVPAFRFHRQMLQLLQWHCPADRWLLKAPSHLTELPALCAVYPDARIIHLHRDPARTVPSTTSLMATLRLMRRDTVDVVALAQTLMRGLAAALDKVITERARGTIPDGQFIDLRYADLMRDPLAAIARVYAQLGLDLETTAETRMRAYLAAKPRGQHGPHRYRLEDFGLDRTAVRAQYLSYMQHYDVPPEE
jgi:hypothetical protein